jgi:hypothetical protein
MASVRAFDPEVVRRLSRYAKRRPRTLGIEPKLLRVTLDTES